ncbi:MAG: hypothetical protein ACM3UQ_00105 [Clostridiales bacterium]
MWKYCLVVLVLFSNCLVLGMQSAFAETQMYAIPTPNLFFTNIHVDTNPVPNKPFTIYADVQSQSVNWNDLIVYITAPPGVSVVSPVVSSLSFTAQGNTERASWTILASETGSFPITLIAHSNFPLDTEKFDITVNVGSPHSLVLSDISVPGNLFANDEFTASIKLKNAATVDDTNILAQIFVPSGLQLLDDVTQSVASLAPGHDVLLKWRLKAEDPGSHVISFNYSSTNAGPNTASTAVNIGTRPAATGALISIATHSVTIKPNSLNQILVDVTNNGIQDLHNLQIVSATGGGYVSSNTPLWIGDLPKNDKKTLTLQINTSNESTSLQIPILVKYDSNGASYTETYQTGLQLGNKPDFKINTVMVTPPMSYAGDSADKIDVQIFNAGIEADDVYAALNLPPGLSPAWGGATSAYFGRIDTFQTVTASFYVNINSDTLSGNYPLVLSVKTGSQETPLNVNFIVAPKAQFQLISADYSQLYPGATNVPFKITMKNTGASTAQTITTTLLAGNAIPGVKSDTMTSVGNTENIGTVLPGQVFTTTFMVDLEPQFAAGDHATTVEINWSQNTTSTSNTFVQNVVVPYHIAAGPSYLLYYNGISIVYVVILLSIISGLVIFIQKRNKRLKLIEMSSSLYEHGMQRNEDSLVYPETEMIEDISAEKKNEKRSTAPKIVTESRQEDDGNGRS